MNKQRLESALNDVRTVMERHGIDAYIVAAGINVDGSAEMEALVNGEASVAELKQFATHIQVGITAAEQHQEAAKARRN